MTLSSLTAVILTKNESIHLARCIASLAQCAERIVVVDSFSTDDTVEIARNAGADVVQNPFRNYASQFNWALDNCKIASRWTMRIDADEYVDAKLADNISQRLDRLGEETTGVSVTRYISFLGRVIRHGGVSPQQTLKIWRTGLGRIESRWMDEHTVLSQGGISSFDGALIDDNLKGLNFWIEKHNRYAIREVIDLMNEEYQFFKEQGLAGTSKEAEAKRRQKKAVYARAPLLYRALFLFVYRYIFRLGFLDGKAGLSFNLLQTLWYRYIVDLKIIEAQDLIQSSGVDAFKQKLKSEYGIELLAG
jgi:glycosyltransferase involved in cell wall biosynthesis